jgi:DNA-binding NarL/FixJ family response regulator
MDVNLPGMSGVEATKILSTELPQTKIIGLSMHTDPAVSEAMRRAGAVAYLTKEDLSQDLLAAIRACASRGRG